MASEELTRSGSVRSQYSYIYNVYAHGDITSCQIGEGNRQESSDIVEDTKLLNDYHDELLDLKVDFHDFKDVVEEEQEGIKENVDLLKKQVNELSSSLATVKHIFIKEMTAKNEIIHAKDETIKAQEETIKANEIAMKAKEMAIKEKEQIIKKQQFERGVFRWLFNVFKEKKKDNEILKTKNDSRTLVIEQQQVIIKIFKGFRQRPKYMETYQGKLKVCRSLSLNELEEKIRCEYNKQKVQITRIYRNVDKDVFELRDGVIFWPNYFQNGDEVYLWWETYQGKLKVCRSLSLNELEEKIRCEYNKQKVQITRIYRNVDKDVFELRDGVIFWPKYLQNGDEVYLWWY